jgi:predicted kinase/CRISPR/Cas system-associated endonuclease Cas3-HD
MPSMYDYICHDMETLKEDSDWHHEESVAVHTKMVMDQFISSNIDMSVIERVNGLLAAKFHDTGKVLACKYKIGKNGLRKVFYGHEIMSSHIFIDYAMQGSKLDFIDVYSIAYMIQNHSCLWANNTAGLQDIKQTLADFGMYNAFKCLLMSDARGRLVDDLQEKISMTEDGLNALDGLKVTDFPVLTDKKCYMMIGCSGSGKTTFCKNLKENGLEAEVFSYDSLRHEFYNTGDYSKAFAKSCEDKVFYGKCMNIFSKLCKTGRNILVDNTNQTPKSRQIIIQVARYNGYSIVAVPFFNSIDTVLKNQENRVDKKVGTDVMFRQYMDVVLPSYGEVDMIMEPCIDTIMRNK